MAERIGVYPGTFDPITLGHIDIIRRGAHLVDKLVIGVTTNPSKEPMFSIADRMAMVRREVDGLGPNISVVEFDSLLMNFAESQGATMIIRGLRAVADFAIQIPGGRLEAFGHFVEGLGQFGHLIVGVELQPVPEISQSHPRSALVQFS